MKKIISAIIAATLLAGAFAGCAGNNESKTSEATTVASSEAASKTEAVTEAATEAATSASNEIGTVSNTLASDKDALISTLPSKFRQVEYTDSEMGLSVTYNLYLPDNYDESKKYPTVVFIADSSVANGNSEASLTQGLGALVWASNEWQSVNETIVINPILSNPKYIQRPLLKQQFFLHENQRIFNNTKILEFVIIIRYTADNR